jgi:hypothetical protein
MTSRTPLLSLAMVLFSTACGPGLIPLSVAPEMLQQPALSDQHTAQLGDTLVVTSRLVKIPAIHVAEPIEQRTRYMALPARLKIEAGTFLARYTYAGETCYQSQSPRMATVSGDPIDVLLCVNQSGTARVVQADDPGDEFPLQSPIRFERTTFVDRSAPSFEQELVYNGRAGDVLKFLYREFLSDTARPPFTQEVQYDLKAGNTIGFKSARIEVIDATNTSITYRVLAHFPPPRM